VIGGMHHQHEDSPLRLAWDPEIAIVDRTTTDTCGIVSLCTLDFTPGVRRIGRLEERSPEESTAFQQLMIAWLTRGS
jgi:hypothetical protein